MNFSRRMYVKHYPLALLLVMLLATRSSEGRLEPVGAGPDMYPPSLDQPTKASGRTLHSAASNDAGSTSSHSTGSKQDAAVHLAGQVLQQLTSQFGLLQEQLQLLHKAESQYASPLSDASRTLLEDTSSSSPAGTPSGMAQQSSDGTATATTATSSTATVNDSSSSSSNATGNVCVMWSSPASAVSTVNASTSTTGSTQNTNARKIGSRVNLVISDGWLITWSGLQILQACVQILGTLVAAAVDGVVTIDSQLVLRLVDLGSAFSSGVSYLLYSVFLLNSDAVAPWV
jgi:type II secretory pathway pseudopilin PulG